MPILSRYALMLAALLAWTSCQTFDEVQRCRGAKCDDPGDDGHALQKELMQKSPPGESAIRRDQSGKWFFHTLGDLGEIVLSSQPYVARASAANGILALEQAGVDLNQYEVVEAEGGKKVRVIVRAVGNNQEIASSRSFDTVEEAQAAIAPARELIASIVQFKAGVEKGARFELSRRESGAWIFTLVDVDGAELLFSQDYQGRTSAINGILAVRTNGKDAARYANNGDHFILRAGNNQEIARSATFAHAEDTAKTITRVKELLQSERVANPW